jgi:hypothetical protein
LILKRQADCFGDKRFHLFFANPIMPVTKQFVLPQFFEKRSSTLFLKGYICFSGTTKLFYFFYFLSAMFQNKAIRLLFERATFGYCGCFVKKNKVKMRFAMILSLFIFFALRSACFFPSKRASKHFSQKR